jgi:hypothetical protein
MYQKVFIQLGAIWWVAMGTWQSIQLVSPASPSQNSRSWFLVDECGTGVAHFNDIYVFDRLVAQSSLASASVSSICRHHHDGRGPECAPDGEEGWKGFQCRVCVNFDTDVPHGRVFVVP